MTRRLLALVAVLLPLSGCVSFEMNRLGSDLRHDIEAGTDLDVGGGFAMGFGRLSLGTTRFVTWVAAPNSTREVRRLARHVKSVKFGRYPIRGAFDGRQIPAPAALARYERDGWFPFVTVRDSASAVWVFARERGDDPRLTDLLTVVAAEDDLVLTKVSGNLTRLVLDAVEMGVEGGLFGGALDETGVFSSEEPDEETATPDAPPDTDV